MLLFCPHPTLAARRSKSVKDDNGMEITITCMTNTRFILEDFQVYVLIELSMQPVHVVKLFNVDIKLKLLVNGTEICASKIVRFPDVNQNLPRGNYISVPYKSTWGKVNFQLKLKFFVDKVDPLPSLAMATEWFDFFNFKKAGSYATNFDWVFIILGSVSIFSIGFVLYKRFLKY
jgi:hypothetical protein